MKTLLICICFTVFLLSLAQLSIGKAAYSSKYDNFDVNSVLASKRLVTRYGDCLMERGPCPPEGRFLKG